MRFDICFCNMGLNYSAWRPKKKKKFDRDGQLAARGIVEKELLDNLAEVYSGLRKKENPR